MSQKSYNKRDNCFYCERKFTLKNYGEGNAVIKTVDHIIPESKGGVDYRINTVVSCKHCNNLKHSLSIDEYIERVKGLIQRGETFGNIPKESLNTIIRKAQELKQYVEDKGAKLYKKSSNNGPMYYAATDFHL